MLPSSNNQRRSIHVKKSYQSTHQNTQRTIQRAVDFDSGQVYNETEIVFRSKNATNWIRDYRTPSIIKKVVLNARGPRTLGEMARSQCVNDMKELIPDHFAEVPWTLAEKLWDETVSRHMESFYAWRTLASVYDGEAEFSTPENRYFLSLRQTPLPLRDYYDGLTSSSNKWHVAMRISPKQHTAFDLVQIANITNVAALDLSDGQLLLDTRPSVFDHRIMRTWSELAQTRKSFQDLRVLMFGWQDNISEWLFEYLDNFRSLCYVIVTDCKDLHQKNRSAWEDLASQKGWSALHAKRSAKTLRTFLEDRNFQLGNISNLYYQGQVALDTIESSNKSRKKLRPLVECWIGTPRPWTHIIDEFPGTRTIWFEKVAASMHNVVPAAPKRVREQVKPVEVSSSPPPKRTQKRVKKKGNEKRAADAASLLGELDCINIRR